MQPHASETAMLFEIEEAESSKLNLPHKSHTTHWSKNMLWRAIGCSMLLATTVVVGSIHGRFTSGNNDSPPTAQTHHIPAGVGLLTRQGLAVVPTGAMDSVVDLALKNCGGPCKDDYTCVVAKTYSQCIDCSFTGNWQYDCPTYDKVFQKAAIETCGIECDGKPPVPPNSQYKQPDEATANTAGGYCALGPVVPDSHEDRCFEQDDGSLQVMCEHPNPKRCGMRFSSYRKTGAGAYTVAMQPPLGAGIATKFYLYTFGRNESRSKAWNSIAFEVFGIKCGKKKSQILTTFESGKFGLSHPKYITVPFDACYDWHTYEIYVDEVKIMWMVDGEHYRKETIEDDDMKDTIDNMDFQAHIKLYAQDKENGKLKDMGYLEDSEEEFPLYGWFGNLDIPKPLKHSSTHSHHHTTLIHHPPPPPPPIEKSAEDI